MPHRASIRGRRFAQIAKELNDDIADGDLSRESKLRLESIVVDIRDQPEVVKAHSREHKRIVAAIRRSLEEIHKYDPRLAQALGGALKTRGCFSYSPESTGAATHIHASEPEPKRLPRKD
jgi:hypothetical protein